MRQFQGAPSLAEIRSELGLKSRNIAHHIGPLVEKKCLEKKAPREDAARAARNLLVTKTGWEWFETQGPFPPLPPPVQQAQLFPRSR